MSKLKVVLFDLDNTLIDRQKAALGLMSEMVDIDFPANEFDEEVRKDALDKLYNWDREGHEPKESSFGKYAAFTKIEGRDWKHYEKIWQENLWRYTELFDQSIETLDYLKKKYRLALLTNGSVSSQNNKVDIVNIRDYFEDIIISGTYGFHKPDKRIFDIVLERLNIKADECIYVGDALYNDIEGALNAGMHAIWAYPYINVDTDVLCQRIYQVKDLKHIL